MITTDGLLKLSENVYCDTVRLKVVLYILEHTDRHTYLYKGSLDDIARGSGVSFSAVQNTMKACQNANLISFVSRGLWRIEERVFEPEDGEEPFAIIRNYV